MANFAIINNQLEGALGNQIAAARANQDMWEWFNALFRVVSQNRYTGTAKVYGPRQLSAGTNVVETTPAAVFGVLIDNSQAAEDAYLATSNVAATPGTTDTLGYYFAVRGAVSTYLSAPPRVHASRLEVFSVLGTEAGLEAGTASTTQPTVIVVYTQ